jgi:hypothetical protein
MTALLHTLDTGDPHLDLMGAVFLLALRDAEQGDLTALDWLRDTAPTVASRLGQAKYMGGERGPTYPLEPPQCIGA